MRVLYPILHYPPVIGGLEQWAQNVAERQPADIEVIVVTGRVKNAPDFDKNGNVTIIRTSLFALSDLSHSSVGYIAGVFPFLVARSLFLSRNADIYHCHGFVSALAGYVLSILTRKPFIGTEQNIIWQNPLKRYLCGIVYRKAVVCIASSKAVAEEFQKVGVKRIEVIPNGVDLKEFSYVGYRKPHISGEFVVLSVGRLEKVKGHKYLIDAFAQIKKEVPGAKLVLVGGGSLMKDLRFMIYDLGLADSAELTGEVAHNKLSKYYAMADVFVMPSLSEGFGITALEAMASGLPLVATRAGSLLEIVSDGQNGILVGPGEAGQISEAVLRIYNDKQLAESIRESGRKRAGDFDWEKSAERVYKIYNLYT